MNRRLLNSLIVIAVGLALIFLRATAVDIVVKIVGAMLLMVAAVNVVAMLRLRASATPVSAGVVISTAVTAILGLWMVIDPAALTNMLVYVFAAMMIAVGLAQLYSLHFGTLGVKFSPLLDVIPALVAICGVVILLIGADSVKSSLVLIAGITMAVCGVGNLLQAFALRSGSGVIAPSRE